MTETKDKKPTEEKKTLSLGKGTLSLKPGGSVAKPSPQRQHIAQGRGKTVSVEVRRKRASGPGDRPVDADAQHQLTTEELDARARALREAQESGPKTRIPPPPPRRTREEEEAAGAKPADTRILSERERELAELEMIEQEERRAQEAAAGKAAPAATPGERGRRDFLAEDEEEEASYRARMKKTAVVRRPPVKDADRRRSHSKMTVTQALNEDYERDARHPSLAAQRRAREKARMAMREEPQKVLREVVVPETITVQELSNRMAERSVDLIKALMKMGVMATVNQTIDADTAELLIAEFGHRIKRVTDADVEVGIEGAEDMEEQMLPRPPVVTVMGHVDHGKTSLLDALRQTDVVSGEAGGITQHIGAYQVTMHSGDKITFLDTPGHAAFSQMRARGANITDIVVLVVAANDSIMPQTVEAINHAKAAGVPIIVAINKIDLPDANPQKVRNDLLQHELVPEELGGDTICVEVSAKKKLNLDKLEEMILLQAEVLQVRANPNRMADGVVIEAKLEQGRGNVATVLIQRGTLRIGDMFVVGTEWGRVRAMMDDRGTSITEAVPGQPVEVLGLNGAPQAGDSLVVVENEAKAREISEYRSRKRRFAANIKSVAPSSGEGAATLDDLLAHAREGAKKQLPVVIKGDVHGSVEAIIGSLRKIEDENPDIKVRVLHSGVGAITESDVTLAGASGGLIIGFNVRANAQARELAEREKVDMRYYNIIYNVIDDAKKMLSGLLEPTRREEYLGQASVRQVFTITKVGKVAGCMVTAGTVKRGASVRLLRDNVVIHEGRLKTLKRFQDEVKEVKEGTECGMAFENYDDLKEGDVIECYEIVEEVRTVA
jgi:translation initiation factor IF-2